jgi:hypothetical protein
VSHNHKLPIAQATPYHTIAGVIFLQSIHCSASLLSVMQNKSFSRTSGTARSRGVFHISIYTCLYRL